MEWNLCDGSIHQKGNGIIFLTFGTIAYLFLTLRFRTMGKHVNRLIMKAWHPHIIYYYVK